MTQWSTLGIEWITLLLDDQNEGPPSTAGAQTWINNFGLTLSYVAADPQFSMVPGNSVGTPQFSLIDPRTMVVTLLVEGIGGNTHNQLVALAQQNQ